MSEAIPGIDPDPVGAWLRAHVPDAGSAEGFAFARIGDGRSNLTFRVAGTDGSGPWILRRPPLGPRLRGAHDMAREHRLLAALRPAGARVPAPLGLCEDESVTGAPFYVMELVEGLAITDLDDVAAVPEDRRDALARSLVRELAALHAVDVDAADLGDLARREGYAERQVKGWWRQWEASRTRDVPAIDRVHERLRAAPPDQRRLSVVHGDYKLENVVSGADGEVRAILDWELCTLGDPLGDLGGLMSYWVDADDDPAWALAGERAPTRAPGFPTRSELVAEYAEASGADLSDLPWYEALGAWRLAIILQGVIRRFRDTPENANMPPDALEPTLDALAARAERLLDGDSITA